ncbi:MAG TPA: aminotransferase class V-fold PLP-dependent enzyme [Clostridiaceae bacterium]|nr:aminotransferase class V-fold PLP-dependent enzyme [Clostridiaceae bacterium]
MIYFDNSATSLTRPPEVGEALLYALNHFGNAGRSFYDAVMEANRAIYGARMETAALIGLNDPLQVAFTSSATESLNLVIQSLVKPQDGVITSITEHNAVLRPLYLRGCPLRFIEADSKGRLALDNLSSLLTPQTRFLICNQASNVTGNVNDTGTLLRFCREQGLTLILDIAQTFGSYEVNIQDADIFCFTGHKGLLGPQGTGGIIVNGDFPFTLVKTGGAGSGSFNRFQDQAMPDIFEAGTLNSPGLYAMSKGIRHIRDKGVRTIHEEEMRLTRKFHEGIRDIPGITIYGDFSSDDRLAVVSLKLKDWDSADLAAKLWDDYAIATRAGAHCAPLLHRHFGTEVQGMVRFSFSAFNTEDEIEAGIRALERISRS